MPLLTHFKKILATYSASAWLMAIYTALATQAVLHLYKRWLWRRQSGH
jgi:hypothetical protein